MDSLDNSSGTTEGEWDGRRKVISRHKIVNQEKRPLPEQRPFGLLKTNSTLPWRK